MAVKKRKTRRKKPTKVEYTFYEVDGITIGNLYAVRGVTPPDSGRKDGDLVDCVPAVGVIKLLED